MTPDAALRVGRRMWRLEAALLLCIGCTPALPGDALLAGFQSPPQEARPRVWWHWMNGNVTDEGVRLDLEWMKRVGIGGVQNFDAALEWGGDYDTPQIVATPVNYLSSTWRATFRNAVNIAKAAGLEFTIATSAGWSMTAGPWVKPHEAMKKLVWSETDVAGGRRFKGRLAAPPRTTGLFQNIPMQAVGQGGGPWEQAQYYADVATVAYRAPLSEVPIEHLKPVVTSSAGALDDARLWDGDLARAQLLPFGDGPQAWVQFDFPKAQRIQAITAVITRPLGLHPPREPGARTWLEVSDDGRSFQKVVELPRTGALEQTVSFVPVQARTFRVVIERRDPSRWEKLAATPMPTGHELAEIVLHTAARVNRFEDKAGFSSQQILSEDDTTPVAVVDAVRTDDIIDLSSRVSADGTLDWTPPRGRWVVMRFGYSLTGRINFSASRSGKGLEVDKLSREHVKRYMDAYLNEYADVARDLDSVLIDSYEALSQNWTENVLAQFRARRGYDASKWLPVLAGRVVESAAASDRFLWDFRKTLGELMIDAHYGQIVDSLQAHGLQSYGESHESGRAFIGDGMEARKRVDVPMGATWSVPFPGYRQESADADLKESASVAHIYGKRVVAAESFTSYGYSTARPPYSLSPRDLKPIADRMLASGVNQFVIHTSAHQPDERPGPGVTLGPYGLAFTRKETWGEQARPWLDYLARSSYLLQQGRSVADIAYLYGEDTNVTSLFGTGGPPIPGGYNFDFLNADALLNEISVQDGALVARSGMRYRVLVLDPSTRRMTVPVLRRLRDLVRAGATIVGTKPTETPSLADDEKEFHRLATEVWGDGASSRSVGPGRVLGNASIAEALTVLQIPPDVSLDVAAETSNGAQPLRFVHRALPEGDLYFVNGDVSARRFVAASFRVSARRPELWRADTGVTSPVSYRIENGRTIVPLDLGPEDAAVFVLFREPTGMRSALVTQPVADPLATLEGSWEVSFAPHRGAPAHARFETLRSWTESNDPGVKYFAGTATCHRKLTIRPEWLSNGSRVQLDLGEVRNLAEVIVNGRPVGVLWKAPFSIDITAALQRGENDLQIKVTNLWPNRLIGDKQPGAQQIAFATFDPFKVDSPLLPSGLLGPVRLMRVEAQ